jgi:RNA polymerase sigma-70 factor (ECF subfamily)
MTNPMDQIEELLQRAISGDREALATAFHHHRSRLKRMVAARMDQRLKARISASDVMQDVFLEAQNRIEGYQPHRVSFFVWLRTLTSQKLIDKHRFHIDAKKRSARREASPVPRPPDASTISLATYFIGQLTSASTAMLRDQVREKIQAALEGMDPLDREILSLRHFEQLSNQEAAEVLGMNGSSTSTRHLRALKKLKNLLQEIPEVAELLNVLR